MTLQENWFPYLITHAISFVLVFVCFKWPKAGKVVWGTIFILAGIFNIIYGIVSPQSYLTYGQTAVPIYQKIISGVFSSFTSFVVSMIGLGQILVGFFLFKKKTLFLLGTVGGVLFLLAIAPLGIGSAFPSTLFMALSLILMYTRYNREKKTTI